MKIGKIEWYTETRGFGIVSSLASDGVLDKFYVHITKIVKSPEKIKQGQRVEFEVNPIPPRPGHLPAAVNVTITETAQDGEL